VAGIGKMGYGRFAIFNVAGGLVWVNSFLIAGYYFGQNEFVKKHFAAVAIAIVVISLVPIVVEFIRARRERILEEKKLTVDS
jgi:membrane-associated protein